MRPGGLERGRTGFALPWIILTVAIIAALVATAAPTLATLDDRERALSAAAKLESIAGGFVAFEDAVGHYPGNLWELTTPITMASKNTCRGNMKLSDVSNWPDEPPYAPFYMPPNGAWTDIGRIRDSVPARAAPPLKTPIYIELPGVSGEDAAMLKAVVDGAAGDTVSFAAPVNDTTTIRYRVLSSGRVVNNRC